MERNAGDFNGCQTFDEQLHAVALVSSRQRRK
jgi:hypothetical protein